MVWGVCEGCYLTVDFYQVAGPFAISGSFFGETVYDLLYYGLDFKPDPLTSSSRLVVCVQDITDFLLYDELFMLFNSISLATLIESDLTSVG